MAASPAVRTPRWAQYEALCEKRDAVRAEHKAAEGDRDLAARIIADYVSEGIEILDVILDDYRAKRSEVDRLRSAWFDARDEVETFMGRPVTKR